MEEFYLKKLNNRRERNSELERSEMKENIIL